ncbi:MAG TPA: SusC/RagA family TonB-linked outer membrane protein [Gemmatimonadaceae bacterium]|nr:SusC/RagA family TonB-linked outer membrane protein [Gemmatimonadaceae bacterium]
MIQLHRQFVKVTCAVMLLPSALFAQEQSGAISGRVIDRDTQQPIASAQVVVVGTQVGAVTDDRGEYRITRVTPGSRQLRALRLGYQSSTQTVAVRAGETATADFTLGTAAVNLDQVVITATGETQRKRESGAITSTIAVDALDLAPITNFSQVLTGRAPGVAVQLTSGTLGSGTRIRIRGTNSISLANDPLLIIDGVRVNNTVASGIAVGGMLPSRLDDLNPDEIENIEVIKGPAAAALYGTAAANGVIQVTTKRGRPGKTRFSLYAEQGTITEVSDFPFNYRQIGDLTTPRADGTTRTTNCNIANRTDGLCTIRQDSLAKYSPLLSDATPFIDGWRQDYGLNVTGGGEAVTYFVSGDFERQQGVFDANTTRKVGLRANVFGRLRDDLELTANAGYVSNRIRLPQNDNNALGLLGGGLLGSAFDNPDNRGYFAITADQSQQFRTRQDVERFTGSLSSNWRPLAWLSAAGSAGLDVVNRFDHDLLPAGRITAFGLEGGFRQSERYQDFAYTANLSFTGAFDLRPTIRSTTTLGGQYVREVLRSTEAFGQNLLPGVGSLEGVTSLFAVDEDNTENVTVGTYIQQQVAWRDRLFVTLALRGDDNSAFGQDFGFVNYPAASLSWVVGEEPFFPQVSFLSAFRVRAAYGESGQRPSFRDAAKFFSPVSVMISDVDVPGVTIGSEATGFGAGNALLKPEKSKEYEFGFDLGFLGDRLALELTRYDKTTYDALIARDLPGSLGATAFRLENIGRVRNHGFEMLLKAKVFDMPNASFDLTLNGTTANSRILELGEGIEPIPVNSDFQIHKEGLPPGSYYQAPYTFSDANRDGLISMDEVVVADEPVGLGTPFPKRMLSVTPDLTLFRYVRVSGLFEYRGGHKLLNLTERFRCNFTQTCRGLQDASAPLEEQARAMATLLGTEAGFVEDADFVKFRELAVTLNAPEQWAGRMGVASVSLTLAGRNLKTWTDYTGFDPEANENAANTNFSTDEFNTQPQVRYFTARINVGW